MAPAGLWTPSRPSFNDDELFVAQGFSVDWRYLDELLATDPNHKDKSSKHGLGVYVTKSALGTSYGRGGWCPGYRSHVDYYPAQRVAIAVQTSTDVRDDMLGDLMALIGDVPQTVGKSSLAAC